MDSPSSPSSSSSEDEVELGPEQLEGLMGLEAALEAEPSNYAKHVEVRRAGCCCCACMQLLLRAAGRRSADPLFAPPQYIGLLRQARLKARLRSAHERMADLFPLSEQLWLDWVNDELEQVPGKGGGRRAWGGRAGQRVLRAACSALRMQARRHTRRRAPMPRASRGACAHTARTLHAHGAGAQRGGHGAHPAPV